MSYKIISKFIQDISFEIPNAKTYAMLEKEIPKYNLNFDIKSKPFKENIIEVNTILSLIPNQYVKYKILTEKHSKLILEVQTSLKEHVLAGKCSFCDKKVNKELFKNLSEIHDYHTTGMCRPCLNELLKEPNPNKDSKWLN